MEKMKECYFGIFGFYKPGLSVVKTLVMAGQFTSDDLLVVNQRLEGEGIKK